MKTLNRPMFRYGGPIKEGIMDGIRENKRHGGSMGNNQGPRRAALVGNPIYPNVAGRTNHVVPAVIGAGLAVPVLGTAIRAAARPFGQFVMRNAPRFLKSGKPMLDKKGIQKTYAISKKNPGTQGFDTNALGGYFSRDPVVGLGGKVASGLLSPATGGVIQKGARFVFSPSGVVLGGVYYANGKYFNKKGEEIKKPKDSIVGNSKEGMESQLDVKELTADEKKALENKARMEKMDSYREILNIKGMNKDAAYKSLIDASKIIREGGNLKEQIKDGSLISKVTEAASKRFDKVSDTDTALRSLIAKGEIQKDMSKEENALAKLLTTRRIEALDNAADISFSDNKLVAAKNKLLGQAGVDFAARSTKGIDFKGNLIEIADFQDVIKVVKEDPEQGNLNETEIIESWTNNFIKDKNVSDGDYTVGDAIVTIKDKIVQKIQR